MPGWRPAFLTSETSASLSALLSITVINLLVSPFTILLNVLVVIAVKTRPRLRNKYNALLACLAATDSMTGAIGQPLFVAEQIYRLKGDFVSDFCAIRSAAGLSYETFNMVSLHHLALISIERFIAIKFPHKYHEIITKSRMITVVV